MFRKKHLLHVFVVLLAFCWPACHQVQAQAVIRGESLHLHIAKSFYMPGEILWFRAYLQDAATGSPLTPQSSVAYVEILDQKQESVLRTKIALGPDHSNGGSLYIPAHLLSGRYTIVAYTALMKHQGAADFFAREIEILNPYLPADTAYGTTAAETGSDGHSLFADHPLLRAGRLTIEASPDRTGLATREKVTVSIQTILNNQAAAADLSVSVYRTDELQAAPDPSSAQVTAADRPGAIGPGSSSARPEQRYHQVAFRLTDKVSKSALAMTDVLLTVAGPHSMLYTGTTDENGLVVFYVKDVYGTNQLAIRLEDGRESDVELISPFFDDYRGSSAPGRVEQQPAYDPALREVILERSLNVQAENSYFARERAYYTEPLTDGLPFFGERVVVYHLDDYTRFVLMEEVLREYVTEIRLQRRGGDYRFRVLDAAYGHYFNQSPLVLLDGVPVAHENAIVAFDPLKIEKISIVTGRYYLGNGVYDGVVNFSTYDGYLSDFPLDPSVTLIEYEGLQQSREFFSPVHDGSDTRLARLPDSRNVLYWNPSVKVDESGRAELSFYTSDMAGDYVVVIQGMTISGHTGSTVTRFSVSER